MKFAHFKTLGGLPTLCIPMGLFSELAKQVVKHHGDVSTVVLGDLLVGVPASRALNPRALRTSPENHPAYRVGRSWWFGIHRHAPFSVQVASTGMGVLHVLFDAKGHVRHRWASPNDSSDLGESPQFYELPKPAQRWLVEGDRGDAADALFGRVFGFLESAGPKFPFPTDPDDFSRCVGLVEQVQLPRAHLDAALRTMGTAWSNLGRNWDEMVGLHLSGTPASATRLQSRIEELVHASD